MVKSLFFQWLGEIGNSFPKLLFCYQIEYLLAFTGIGMAIVLFSSQQSFSILPAAEKVKKEISKRRSFSNQETKHHQAIEYYLALLSFIEAIGVFYFLAMLPLLAVITFPPSSPVSPPSPFYIILVNLSYLFVTIPTALISICYIYYKLFRYRIH